MNTSSRIALVTGATRGIGAIKVDAIHPGNVRTDMNPTAELDVGAGARTSVRMALLGDDGPTGTFTHMGEPLPW